MRAQLLALLKRNLEQQAQIVAMLEADSAATQAMAEQPPAGDEEGPTCPKCVATGKDVAEAGSHEFVCVNNHTFEEVPA